MTETEIRKAYYQKLAAKATAESTFKEHATAVDSLLRSIASEWKKKKDAQKKDPMNWVLVGDVSYIRSKLELVEQFLQGRGG